MKKIMKKIIKEVIQKIILAMSFLIVVPLNQLKGQEQVPTVQGTDDCKDCRKKFPYIFCEDGVSRTICTDNPNCLTKNPNTQRSVKFFRPTLPICFNYINNPFNLGKQVNWKHEGGIMSQYSRFIYDKEHGSMSIKTNPRIPFSDVVPLPSVTTIINNAAAFWNNLACSNKQTGNHSCCINIKWAQKLDDFVAAGIPVEEVTKTSAVTVMDAGGFQSNTGGRGCDKVSCKDIFIYINDTEEFRNNNSWFVDDEWKRPQDALKEGTAVNFYNTIAHELGHFLGFHHPDASSKCSYNGRMMEGYSDNEDNELLSNDEMCMFRLAYCCPCKPVDIGVLYGFDRIKVNHFSIIPNPVGGGDIQLSSGVASVVGNLHVVFVDSQGNEVLNKEFASGVNYTISSQGIPNGTYKVFVWDDINYGDLTLVVQK